MLYRFFIQFSLGIAMLSKTLIAVTTIANIQTLLATKPS